MNGQDVSDLTLSKSQALKQSFQLVILQNFGKIHA